MPLTDAELALLTGQEIAPAEVTEKFRDPEVVNVLEAGVKRRVAAEKRAAAWKEVLISTLNPIFIYSAI